MDTSKVAQKAREWLQSNIDGQSKDDIRTMMEADDQSALIDAFYKDLEFGTGGLRGVMGIGSNRINKYTIGKATQGLSNYLLKCFPGTRIRVAIAHDSRNNSRQFAETTAAVFSANGIEVFFFEDLRPTPELSFAIRTLGCQSGVVLTASHNPKEYNGYKAYWEDGGQVVPPHDKNIIDEVNAIEGIDSVCFEKKAELIHTIGQDIDEKYLEAICGLSVSPEAIKRQNKLKIVFSSIHGTGITLVPEVLKRFGFENVHIVQEQAEPNGNFPTVVYPNPEEPEAMDIALKQAQELNADLIAATDPDADRVGIGAKNHQGKYQLLNGNQAAALLVYYMLRSWQEKGKIDGNQYIVKTIVTSELLADIAAHFKVECHNTLTGFKYIAEIIRKLEGKKTFVVGGEESYGYLTGDFVRDKDAISSCAMLSEMTAWAADQGMGLFDLLASIYQQFGFYRERLISLTKKGATGADEIREMMKKLRSAPPDEIAGSPLVQQLDYLEGTGMYKSTGQTFRLDFPKSNVLQFITEDGTKVSARPSGTEPKIKFYFSVRGQLADALQYKAVEAALDQKIDAIIDQLGLK